MDSTLVTTIVGALSFVWGCYQWRAGRRDSKQQQAAANVLQAREQTLEELREMAEQRRADAASLRSDLEATRADNVHLRQTLGDALHTIDVLRRAVLDETARAAGLSGAQQIRTALGVDPGPATT